MSDLLGPDGKPLPENPLLTFARTVLQTPASAVDPLLDDPQPARARHHQHVLLLQHKTKTAVCKQCGMEMTAFEALVYLAKDWSIYTANLKAVRSHIFGLERDQRAMQAEVTKLKAIRRRLEQSIASKVGKLTELDRSPECEPVPPTKRHGRTRKGES